jgi:protein involved in sex pheromone biosynthesis
MYKRYKGALSSFDDYIAQQITRCLDEGNGELAESLQTELQFKNNSNRSWDEYYNRSESGEREIHAIGEQGFEEYLYFLRKPKTYLGQQELIAYANLHSRSIYTYNPSSVLLDTNGNPKIENGLLGLNTNYQTHPEEQATEPPIYLSHTMGNHYELLLPKNQ